MRSSDIKIGQRVTTYLTWEDAPEPQEWIILERAPGQGMWWLQCAETGRVSGSWKVHARDLQLVADDYRPGEVLEISLNNGEREAVRIRHRFGDWIIHQNTGASSWSVSHAGSGMWVNRPQTLSAAKDLAWRLYNRFPLSYTEQELRSRSGELLEVVREWWAGEEQ